MLLKYLDAGVPTSTTELPARELIMESCSHICIISLTMSKGEYERSVPRSFDGFEVRRRSEGQSPVDWDTLPCL